MLATIPSAVLVTACSYAIAAVFTVAATVCVFGVGDPRIHVDSAIGWGGILYKTCSFQSELLLQLEQKSFVFKSEV